MQWVQFRMSPGLRCQFQVHSLSIHIRSETNFTNGGLCVHMSLNNNCINIQCFQCFSLWCCSGRERSCSNSVLKIMSWEQAHEIFFFFFHFHLRFVLTEDAKCLIHERIHRTRSKCLFQRTQWRGEGLEVNSYKLHPQRSKVNLEEQVVTDVGLNGTAL